MQSQPGTVFLNSLVALAMCPGNQFAVGREGKQYSLAILLAIFTERKHGNEPLMRATPNNKIRPSNARRWSLLWTQP